MSQMKSTGRWSREFICDDCGSHIAHCGPWPHTDAREVCLTCRFIETIPEAERVEFRQALENRRKIENETKPYLH